MLLWNLFDQLHPERYYGMWNLGGFGIIYPFAFSLLFSIPFFGKIWGIILDKKSPEKNQLKYYGIIFLLLSAILAVGSYYMYFQSTLLRPGHYDPAYH